MRRRDFITLLGSATAAWPLGARAQQPSQIRRIGVLIASSAEADPEGQRSVQALLQGLQDLGWKPGTNLQVDIRYGDGNRERIAAVAKELVAVQPEVLEVETTPGTAAVLKETHTIPIVFTSVSDPVGAGFVQSLSHPGGNTTGFINIESSIGGKWLQLLKEVMPQVTRATVLFNLAAAPQADYYRRAIEAAAPAFGNHDKDGSRQRYGRDGKGNRGYRPGSSCGSDHWSRRLHRRASLSDRGISQRRQCARRLSIDPIYHRRRAAFVW
jgi:putative tryptophan/tyrosine transport system substrate-binding protein